MPICIIPARGGSKRIPRKNIRQFCGQPIITWSIKAAASSHIFDRIIVSTDDYDIANVAINSGAEVPFMRPSYLSDDYTGTTDVIRHAIGSLETEVKVDDIVCCLYPTAPFVRHHDIKESYDLLKASRDGTIVFTATSFPFPIQRAIRINADSYSSAYNKEYISKRSQDLEDFYHDAGQFYLAEANTWRNSLDFFEQGRPLILPRWRVHDIDTEEDWKRAELVFSALSHEIRDDIA